MLQNTSLAKLKIFRPWIVGNKKMTTTYLIYPYCRGLIEWPITELPFIIIQHAHLLSKQSFASSCLHIWHIQTCLVIVLRVVCCLDFVSTYNHSKTSGNPRIKNTIAVRTGMCNTKSDIPKTIVPIPSIAM